MAQRLYTLLALAALIVGVAACAAGPAAPTATPVPLAATATAEPRPTRLPATDVPVSPVPTAAAPTPTEASRPATLDKMLVRRTVEGFLNHLVAGEVDSAANLYLSAPARQGEAGELLAQLATAGWKVAAAVLLEIERATPTTYQARAAVDWSDSANGAGRQAMTLGLVNRSGLWLIDAISLGDFQAVPPTAAPPAKPAAASGQPLRGSLVFQTSSGGALYVVGADGRGLRRLTDGLDPAWSPDGTQIAFTRWRTPSGVYLIQSDGSGETRLVDGPRLKEATWSPDGTRIVFTINLSSAEPIVICLPDGTCYTLPPFAIGQMWLVQPQGGELLSLPLDLHAMHAPSWSPQGHRIVYAGDRGLAWIDLGTQAKGVFAGGSAWDAAPAFSPDGRAIAYMSRLHNHWEVWVMQADGSGRHPLASSDAAAPRPANNVAPAWSPDGRQIAFLSDRDGPWRIYVMNADGSGQRSMFGDKLDGLGLRYEWASERVISWTR